jgi:hypothetical protein
MQDVAQPLTREPAIAGWGLAHLPARRNMQRLFRLLAAGAGVMLVIVTSDCITAGLAGRHGAASAMPTIACSSHHPAMHHGFHKKAVLVKATVVALDPSTAYCVWLPSALIDEPLLVRGTLRSFIWSGVKGASPLRR